MCVWPLFLGGSCSSCLFSPPLFFRMLSMTRWRCHHLRCNHLHLRRASSLLASTRRPSTRQVSTRQVSTVVSLLHQLLLLPLLLLGSSDLRLDSAHLLQLHLSLVSPLLSLVGFLHLHRHHSECDGTSLSQVYQKFFLCVHVLSVAKQFCTISLFPLVDTQNDLGP